MRIVRDIFGPLHRDQRGALSVLILLTVFALVAMIALVWNAGEYSVRKRHVQTAADSAAQTAALWTARTSNLVASTTQLLVENASAEVIYRATRDTINAIANRLASEQQRIIREIERIHEQRDRNNTNPRGPDPNLALRLDLKEQVLQAVLAQYPYQEFLLQQLISRTAPGLAAMSAEDFAARRGQMYDYQARLLDLTPGVVDEQRQAIASFYRCDVTLGTPTGGATQAPEKSIDRSNVEGVAVGGVSVPDPAVDRNIWVVGGYWGEIACPPLARFFNDRVDRDIGWNRPDSLIPILRAIDEARAEVDRLIHSILTPPPNAPPPVVRVYSDVLREIERMHLGEGFAVSAFSRSVSAYRRQILWTLGETPLHVLATYDRYPVPEWAKPAVYQDAYQYVYNDVYRRNYDRLWRFRYRELQRDRSLSDAEARRLATEWATYICTRGSTQIAEMAASEWIARTWPYEITPPQSPVPPTRGILTEDRHRYFTLSAAAKSTDVVAPRPFLAKLMDAQVRPLVATAQSETFNWMEYHGSYGAGDRYDHRMPPRPWRLSTAGGWNWQPRLAFSDALPATLANNPEFRGFFGEGGVTSYDAGAIDSIIMH